MDLNADRRDVLLELVAFTDAIWEPYRRRSYDAAVLHELRQRHRLAGIRWSSDELSGSDRKAAQRALEWLAGAGLVEIVRHVGRTKAVRLSDHGEATARRIAGNITTSADALDRLRQITGMVGRPGATQDGRVPEDRLAGVQWGRKGHEQAVALVQLDLLPALVRGWAVARADVHGRVFYHLSDAGQLVVNGDVDLPTFDDLPAVVDGGGDQYVAAIGAARHRIRDMQPANPGEMLEIPLPASMPVIQEGGSDA